ncbi:MAG: sucrase ferredoxin [Sandaracinaceae bacterium]|nr:sucrase ferredoxin [Sandaracinaceae bacterium]
MSNSALLCREESLAVGEPHFGTASTVRRWILIERDGPWGPTAVDDNRFPDDIRARIGALRKATGARVLMIRRFGGREQPGVRVMFAYTARDRVWLEELRLESIDGLFSRDLSPLRRGESVGGDPIHDLRWFVCTHGKHDPCCAKYGRPVAQALDARWPEETWETSHIGGDRFAGNVLILPLGIYYGRVEPENAVSLIAALRDGQLSLRHFRGRTAYPFDVQAAEWWVRQRHALLGLDDLTFTGHRTTDAARSLTTFRLSNGRTLEVDIEKGAGQLRQLTCRASLEHRAPRFRLVAITELDP